jgi:hypothetical protein
VLQKRTRPEDVAEMKRTDRMDAEAKNFEGLKAKNKLFARLLDLA